MKKFINIISRIVIYIYVVILIILIPLFFINYNGKLMDKIAASSNLELTNENKIKESQNEKKKCVNCPHAHKCNHSPKTCKPDSSTGAESRTESK